MATALLKSLRPDWTNASRPQERMSPRQAKSRVVNSDWSIRWETWYRLRPFGCGRPLKTAAKTIAKAAKTKKS